VDNCFAHGAPTANRTSSTKINAEAVSSTSGVPIDRVKTNMAAPLANENTLPMAYSAAGLDHWRKPPPWAVRGVCTALAQLAPIGDEQHEGPSDCDHDQFHGVLPRVVLPRNAQIAAEVTQHTGCHGTVIPESQGSERCENRSRARHLRHGQTGVVCPQAARHRAIALAPIAKMDLSGRGARHARLHEYEFGSAARR